MLRQGGQNQHLSLFSMSLSYREWVYLLSLLVPFVLYNLSLTAAKVLLLPGERGFALSLDLMLSDIFFSFGYALVWIVLFAVARRGPLRWTVVVLFHLSTIIMVLVTTSAYRYFGQTGAALDRSTIIVWVAKYDEIRWVLFYGISPLEWGLLSAALLYAVFGPPVVARLVERRGNPSVRAPDETPQRVFSASPVTLLLLAIGFGFLSLLPDITGPGTEKHNVVLIHLESARAQSVTPYNEDLNTMPFLDELAKESLLAERIHVVVPRSSKGSTAINCGIEPALFPGPEYEPGGIPAPCLADLLKEQDYRTVFFQSTFNSADNFGNAVENFGYEEFYPAETMDKEGYQVTNTFGYEDDIMLEPSEEWLSSNGYDKPFLAQYFTGTGHYGYECVPNRYGYEYFSENEELDRYHNCLRMLDFFLKNLFDQYQRLGLYENTIFVLYGDHGEGFREHGRYMHGDNPYEEGLHVPLLIHAPGWFEEGERVEGLSSQIDVLPTVLEMLGYEVAGKYPGYSLLHELPEDRTLMSSCVYPYRCMASLKGTEKYIYHYGDQPDEFFDLSDDPLEQKNLAGERDKEELEERREELLAWHSRVNAVYGVNTD
jgi:lipoteichoic acid synthase